MMYDREDDTPDSIAAIVAPLFALHGWHYGRERVVPDAARLTATIQGHYDSFSRDDLRSSESGRFVLMRETDGEMYRNRIRVFLDLGELPVLDALDTGDSAASEKDAS